MQTLRPHLRSTESETRKEGEVEVGAKICILISAPANDGLDEVENHWSRKDTGPDDFEKTHRYFCWAVWVETPASHK